MFRTVILSEFENNIEFRNNGFFYTSFRFEKSIVVVICIHKAFPSARQWFSDFFFLLQRQHVMLVMTRNVWGFVVAVEKTESENS